MYKPFSRFILILSTCLIGFLGHSREININDIRTIPSVEDLVKFIGQTLDSRDFDNLIKKYKMTLEKGKLNFYVSKELGFSFSAFMGQPRTFFSLTIKVNNNDYLKDYNIYQGILLFNINRDCMPQDLIKKFKLSANIAKDGNITYKEPHNNYIYDFSFRQGMLISITIYLTETPLATNPGSDAHK